MSGKRKRYSAAYRREAAHLVIDTGRPITHVAREIGVGGQLLGRWVAAGRAHQDNPPPAVDADERAELARLRVENAELRMDREFLKKAAAYADDRWGSPRLTDTLIAEPRVLRRGCSYVGKE